MQKRKRFTKEFKFEVICPPRTDDGKQIIVHNVTENVYARAEKAGNVDDHVKHLVGVMKTPLPLARMFRTSLPAEQVPLLAANQTEAGIPGWEGGVQ